MVQLLCDCVLPANFLNHRSFLLAAFLSERHYWKPDARLFGIRHVQLLQKGCWRNVLECTQQNGMLLYKRHPVLLTFKFSKVEVETSSPIPLHTPSSIFWNHGDWLNCFRKLDGILLAVVSNSGEPLCCLEYKQTYFTLFFFQKFIFCKWTSVWKETFLGYFIQHLYRLRTVSTILAHTFNGTLQIPSFFH